MARPKSGPNPQQLAPAVNVAWLGDLNIYVVHEYELDQIAEGSPATLAFNSAIALISMGFAFLLTVTTTNISKSWVFNLYLFICINFLLVGSVLLVYWWRTRRSVRDLVSRIKGRMPPAPGTQEPMPADPATPDAE